MRVGYKVERDLRRQGFGLIAGCDEAGRGPLAGPVVCAAVILPERFRPRGIIDSKQLTPEKRDELFRYILANSLAHKVVAIHEDIIDRINILQASLLGMRMAVDKLDLEPEIVLVDGNKTLPQCAYPQQAIIKGDSRSVAIAAASILAKVTRDRIMQSIHNLCPEYNFLKNKGYCTREHRRAIMKYGRTIYHRKSFKISSEERWTQEQIAFD